MQEVSVDSGLGVGPWDQAFLADVPLRLLSKSNARRFRRGSESQPAFSDFERALGVYVRSQRPSGWHMGDAAAPLASRPVVVSAIFARSTLDAGNFSKSVLDALEGVLYHNDASVRAVACISERGRSSDDSFRVAFARMPASSGALEISSGLADLVRSSAASWHPAGMVADG